MSDYRIYTKAELLSWGYTLLTDFVGDIHADIYKLISELDSYPDCTSEDLLKAVDLRISVNTLAEYKRLLDLLK